MDTGGVSDVVVHEETGLLARDADELRMHAGRLRQDPALAARLGAAARRRVDALPAAAPLAYRPLRMAVQACSDDGPVVAGQHEALYASLLKGTAPVEAEGA